MDAIRLITAVREALARAANAEAVLAEAWQVRALVEAVAERLGGAAAEGAGRPPPAGRARAAELTGVRDPARALRELLEISTQVRGALVALARATEEVTLYWQCMEAADSVGDAADRIRPLLVRYPAATERS